MFWPCETRTSTCRNFATISSGLYRFLAIAVLLDVKDIPQIGPLQRGRISRAPAPGGLDNQRQAGRAYLATRGAEGPNEATQARQALAGRWIVHSAAPGAPQSCLVL